MFFQETTPDTSGYMIAGFAVTFLVMALYVASIYLRNRNLQRDMTTLHELEDQETASLPASRAPAEKSPLKLQDVERNNGRPPTRNVTKTSSRK